MNTVNSMLWAVLATCLPLVTPDMQSLLQKQAGFSQGDIRAVERGEVVTKAMDSGEKPEIAVVGAMYVGVPAEYFIEKYRDIEALKSIGHAVEMGRFDDPPRLDNLRGLTVDSSDLLAIQECQPGDCDIKLPTSVMDRFRQEVDWSTPECDEQVTEMIRQMLVGHVKAYQSSGNAALGQYDDQKHTARIADEFHELLEASSYFYEDAPDLFSYLEHYPQVTLPNAEDFIIWSHRRYENLRPIMSLNHITILRRPLDTTQYLVASKQIYASHYFEASLDLTALVEVKLADHSPSCLMIYINRSRFDMLRRSGPPGMRGRIQKGILDKVADELSSTKAYLETRYQEERAVSPVDTNARFDGTGN